MRRPAVYVPDFCVPDFCLRCSCRIRSGRRLKIAVDLSHCRLSKAGDPLITLPAGTSCETPDCAVMITPSPSLQCPAMPTCPARMQFLPISDDPARPTCAHSSELAPTFDPCPTWTRLS